MRGGVGEQERDGVNGRADGWRWRTWRATLGEVVDGGAGRWRGGGVDI